MTTTTRNAKLDKIMAMQAKLAEALAEIMEDDDTVQAEPETDGKLDWHGFDPAVVKANAKRRGQNITGKVTQTRIDQWVALYQTEDKPKVQIVKSESDDPWGEFTTKAPSAERQYGRPKASEATEMFRVHPERETVESLTADKLLKLSQCGKPNAKVADFRTIPLNGNQRRCLHLLADGKDSDSVKLVVADAIAVARDALGSKADRYFG